MNLKTCEIANSMGGKLISGSGEKLITKVSTDSRETKKGDIFFAIVGEKNDAHKFIPNVLDAGCDALVISDESEYLKAINNRKSDETNRINGANKEKVSEEKQESIDVILVDDTTKALQSLARYYLKVMPLKKKIAITGSVGKTSTRDMLFSALSGEYKTAKCVKNFNNAYGLPLSILEMPDDTEIAILEMGMSKKGSIDFLSELTRPDMAIITNIGLSHLENFPGDGRLGILKTKMEVTNYLEKGAKLIVNGDNDLLGRLSPDSNENHRNGIGADTKYELVKVKKGEQLGRKISDYGMDGIDFEFEGKEVRLKTPGTHNAVNASLVLACIKELGMDLNKAIAGLENAELTDNRLMLKEKNGIKIIDDTYNAAPDSVKSAIRTLAATPVNEGGKRIAILGDMFELGSEEKEAHMEVGNYARVKKIDKVYAIGDLAEYISKGAGCPYYKTKEDFIEAIGNEVKINKGDIILVKASNGMKFKEIVDTLWKLL